jgi:hypothetical protein
MAIRSNSTQGTIADFLQVSRRHFGLGKGRTGYGSRRRQALRAVVKSLLIAGSVGGPIPNAAYAEPPEAKTAESRTNRDSEEQTLPVAGEWGRSLGPVTLRAGYADETHEAFVLRASQVFPSEQVSGWTRMERAVFNSLMAQLVYQHPYAAISNAMLEEVRTAMTEIVRTLPRG